MTGSSARPTDLVRRRAWGWVRALGGVAVLALLVGQVGAGPFRDGVRVVDGAALAAAFAVGALTTVCCAWRWSLVASGLGVRLPLRRAVTAYYHSLFLNTTLPGGVVGDVHRALRHGLAISDVRLAVRAVVLERMIGLTVQVTASVLIFLTFPSPIRAHLPLVLAAVTAVAAAALGTSLLARRRALGRAPSTTENDKKVPFLSSGRWGLGGVGVDVRRALASGRVRVGVVAASGVVVAGQLAVFLLAARTAGATAPLALLLPLTQLAMLAMALPLNIAGWGPREGVAAWAFAAAGMTADQGIAAAVTYGVLGLVAALPGAAVLAVRALRPRIPLSGGSHV